jgi:2-dehydro-3-deoxyphosphogalactonate aldolase
MIFAEAFARCPLVAILRGVKPDEVEDIGLALVEAGFTLIEVPLNSPDPFTSIARLAHRLKGRALVGAGTVMDGEAVHKVQEAGGQLIVSPHCDPAIITAARAAGCVALPGCMSPTEIFTAQKAGAHAIKLFPAELIGPVGVKALRAVVPSSLPLLAVGGVTPEGMAAYRAAGADGFGLGSALYKPGMQAADVARNARAFVHGLAGSPSPPV